MVTNDNDHHVSGTGNPNQDGIEISRIIAAKLGARYSNIYAPAFVDSTVICEYFLKETYIATAIRKAMYAERVAQFIEKL